MKVERKKYTQLIHRLVKRFRRRAATLIVVTILVLLTLYFAAYLGHEKYQAIFLFFLVTLLGAWAGGAAAFSEERVVREKDEYKRLIGEGNRALFTVALMRNALQNLQQFYIDRDGVRNDRDRAVKMDSPQPDMVQAIRFNIDELGFLLNEPGSESPMVLMELSTLEWHYRNLISTIGLRAAAFEDLHRGRQGFAIPSTTPEAEIQALRTFLSGPYQRLDALTAQFIELVDTCIASTFTAENNLRNALIRKFPDFDFLHIV